MIKKIKNFICKLFGVKQCGCPEIVEKVVEVVEENKPVSETEKWKCDTHNRFKKSCRVCRQLAGVA